MAGTTGITGKQVKDESLTGDDIEDGSVNHSELALNDGTNPHGTTKSDVGLGNADNTSDANKPISIATQTALDLKYDASNPNGYETPAELDLRDTANRDRANHTGTQLASTISNFEAAHDALPNDNPHGVTKAQVGLGNADNTSDINKPVSIAQQAALDLKTDKATLTTKGDLYVRDNTEPVRLGVGTDTFTLVADAASAVGMAWKRLLAAWVSFDPTGFMNFEVTDTNVQLALARFGNFSVADLTEAEGNTSSAQESTTSNGLVSKSTFPFLTTDIKTAGQFSIRWSTEIGQTTKNRNYGLSIRWRPEGGAWTVLSAVELSNSRDDNFIMQGGFKEVTLATDSKIEVDLQYGLTTGGGSCLVRNSAMEIRRISD